MIDLESLMAIVNMIETGHVNVAFNLVCLIVLLGIASKVSKILDKFLEGDKG